MIVLALMFAMPQAQAGCKVEEKKDMDGSSMKTAYMFNNDANGALGLIEKPNGLVLHAPLWGVGQNDAPLEKGGVVKFLLEDGTTFQLSLPDMVVPKASVWGNDILTTWDSMMPITAEQVASLATSKIEAIEIPTAGQAIRLETNKSPWSFMAKKTQKLAACWEENA